MKDEREEREVRGVIVEEAETTHYCYDDTVLHSVCTVYHVLDRLHTIQSYIDAL